RGKRLGDLRQQRLAVVQVRHRKGTCEREEEDHPARRSAREARGRRVNRRALRRGRQWRRWHRVRNGRARRRGHGVPPRSAFSNQLFGWKTSLAGPARSCQPNSWKFGERRAILGQTARDPCVTLARLWRQE